MNWPRWLLRLLEWVLPARQLKVVEAETLPQDLPHRNLVLLRSSGEDWSVGMRCPCGCGRAIELAVFPEAKQRWKLHIGRDNTPTLVPSVWMRDGCRSHFFVRAGRVRWVQEE